MDSLHPVAANEQLMAQGEYNYQVAGKDSGLKESWLWHALPDKTMLHRAEVRGQIAGMKLQQKTHFSMSANFDPITLEMSQDINGQVTHTQLNCFDTHIRQIINIENEESAETEVPVPSGYKLFFPPVSAQGIIAQSYNFEAKGKQALPLVSIRIQPQDALPLSVEVQQIEYEYIEDFEVETPAGQFNCHHFIRHDQHMQQHLWIDKNWVTAQWSVPYSEIMKWDYLLTRYQRD